MASTKPRNVPPKQQRTLGKYEQAAENGVYLYTAAALLGASVIDAATEYIAECNRVAGTPATEAKARLKLAAAVEKLETFHDDLGTFGTVGKTTERAIDRMKRPRARRASCA